CVSARSDAGFAWAEPVRKALDDVRGEAAGVSRIKERLPPCPEPLEALPGPLSGDCSSFPFGAIIRAQKELTSPGDREASRSVESSADMRAACPPVLVVPPLVFTMAARGVKGSAAFRFTW